MNIAETIDMRDWDVSYTELVKWVSETGADLYAVNTIGGDGRKLYCFTRLEDLTAFKLKFKHASKNSLMGYKGITSADTAAYYCPYVPTSITE